MPTFVNGKEIAYLKIKEAIASGELKPAQELQEIEMAEKLGVSRTPIREAFLRLEAEGFVRIIPHKGAIVSKLDLNDIVQISQVREALEGMAARLACGRLDIAKLEEIKSDFPSHDELNTPENQRKSYENGKVLHNYILRSSSNDLIVKTVESLELQFQRTMLLAAEVPGRYERALNEHLNIIEALKKQDPDEAEKRMREHIVNARNSIISALRG